MKTIEQKAKKVPAIRFAGFDDEWVEKKLGDVAVSFGYGLNAAAKPYDGTNKYLRITDIDDSSRDFKKDDLTTPDFDLVKANDYRLDEGDLLFARTGASVGKTFIYKKSDGLVYFAGFLIRAKIKSEYDSKFIFQNTLTNPYDKFVKITSQRSGQPGINAQEYADYSLLMPKLNEQQKLGSFFSNIDSLISLEQKKYDKLTQVKKSMLEKMFPKEGATVPEIRFAGFTGDWVIQNLNNICSIITKQTGFDYSETIKPSLFTDKIDNTYSFIQNKDFEGLNINLDTDFYIPVKIAEKFPKITLDQPSLLISISGRIGNVGLFSLDTKAFIGGAVGICKLNNVEDGKIALFELQSPTGQLYFKSLIKASSHANITVEDIRQIVVTIPKEECEKKKINQYFSHLDSLISLQQRKLEKLKNIKKSLLEKMFV